jgi:two-component system sensor histidine kinase KdpD
MPKVRPYVAAGAEVVALVGVATGLVALLDTIAPITGLGVLYLLAVLAIAIRRGQLAALATAAFSVLAMNFFFIEPRHQLTIGNSENVAALVVFAIVAVVVGRLAGQARARAAQAEERAVEAAIREREAEAVAAAASSVLEGVDVQAQLRNVERSLAGAAGASRARLELSSVPAPADDEIAVRLGTKRTSGWLYFSRDGGWAEPQLARLGQALGSLVDVVLERDRLAAQASAADATRRADVAKTAVLHAISHDLRSPLTAIATAVGGLAGADLGPDDRDELLAVLQSETDRLSHLVDDLLDVSRIQAGAVNPRSDWCDLHEAVAAASAQVRAGGTQHPVELELPADLPLVRADQAQLERVFANLIDNSVRHSPSGVPVRVVGAATAGRVTIKVIDRGRGVPVGERARLFEPFTRGAGSGRGSGLGLAIARGFVEANGGRITVQSGITEETYFAVSFPVVAQPAPVT